MITNATFTFWSVRAWRASHQIVTAIFTTQTLNRFVVALGIKTNKQTNKQAINKQKLVEKEKRKET